MSPETFANRLTTGRVNHLVYASDGRTGLISIWKHENDFILTWEECPAGEQFDESTYTRDERHVYATIEGLNAFLAANNLSHTSFTP